jgi:hypothetical protein
VDDDVTGLKYYDLRDHIAGDLLRGIAPQHIDGLVEHLRERGGLTRGGAAQTVERFMLDLRRELARH